jgi:prepilin peptidase CpaA
MTQASSWPLAVVALCCCIAAVTDLRARIIPNWLTLPMLCGALLLHAVRADVFAVGQAVMGALACGLPAFFLFSRGALGGGDVKLFAALGALLGVVTGLELQLCSFILLSIYALWRSAWQGSLRALLRGSWCATLHLFAPLRFARPPVALQGGGDLPMGLAILLALLGLWLRGLS